MSKEDDKWKDTNVGGIGSDADKALRLKAASAEPAWDGVGMQPGTKVWRVEQFKVVPVEESSYGQFHQGDSYIVLKTIEGEGGKLIRTIYFYLGTETSLDEQGTAAYKTVELDDFFSGEPTQVRVEMGKEPDDFKELFGGNITYLEGGVASGFHKVEAVGYTPRLFVSRRVKGKTTTLRAPLLKELIHPGDSFVLDTEQCIYVYDGKDASPFEKQAANMKAENIERQRSGKAQVTHDVDDGFWSHLGA